ncbi:dynein axonemal assembly factor 6 [Nerophis lumbriciformis]|uniref:dynein axonemal assembly factor 6 n=1 Tax=Nerophis lumbriciformis TaxID=546530 RepID=UPI002ADFDA3A|nr:dynein axonemal assembly factor 6-like [Nerophis lumbriciformis]
MEYLGVSSAQNLQALSALLSNQQKEDDDEDDYKNVFPYAKMSPGNIGPPKKKDKEVPPVYVKENSKDVWSVDEVAEGPQYDDITDPRPQPEYEVMLKQSVGTEDVFLGLNRKDPSSMCCEAMLVKIKLPDSKASDVTLDVKEKFLDLRTPKYKLGLHLPHPVLHQEGKAQFFSEREELEVTLLMNRPLDAVNMP